MNRDLEIYLTKEDARAYMRDREKNLIYQMSFSYRKSKSFNTKATLVFDNDIDFARIKKQVKPERCEKTIEMFGEQNGSGKKQ